MVTTDHALHDGQDSASKTQAEAVMNAIRAEIVRGVLKPGERLGMRALQDRYDAGISPLREALSRLTALNLVTAEGQRGFRVATTSEADLIDLIKTAVWSECTALRAAVALGDRRWEAEVLAAAHRLGIGESDPPQRYFDEHWEEDHRAFHRCLVSACGVPRLLHFRDLLFENVERYRRLATIYSAGDRDVNGEHRALVERVLARDVAGASRLMQAHLLETARILLSVWSPSDEVVDEKMKMISAEIALGEYAPG